MADFQVTLIDDTEKVKGIKEEVIQKALTAVGMEAVARVSALVPVDTGRLRASIVSEVDGNTVIVGTNVEYAPDVEFTEMPHKVGQAHYLRDGISMNVEEYMRILREVLDEG